MNTNKLPTFTILDIIHFERNNMHINTENKSCYVISCRISGESLFFYNNQTHIIKRGDVLYIPSGSSYSQECNKEEIICFHLSITGHVSSKMHSFNTPNTDRMCELFIKASNLWKNRPQNYEYLCMSILYEIIALSNATIYTDKSNFHSMLEPAMRYLDAHMYDTDLSLENVCEQSHISRTYFNKLFYDTYNCTPVSYINNQRINKAKQLLISGNYTNSEIAFLCGYKDIKYFYVLFKKTTGRTTKEYRRLVETGV